MAILGIDIGGSGIKGALVDLETGSLLDKRIRIPTPEKPTPQSVVEIIDQLAQMHDYHGEIGVAFPGVIQGQTILTAANMGEGFIGVSLSDLIREKMDCSSWLLNDADAAGMGEMRYGTGKDVEGTVIMVTVGTGLGTAIFNNGHLFPNTEIGHLITKNKDSGDWEDSEVFTSDAARRKEDLKWSEWGKRFNRYLRYVESLFWPELFIVGGGTARKFHKFQDCLKIDTPVQPAVLQNRAGIIGAASAAHEHFLKISQQ